MEKDNLSSLYNALISKGYSTDDLGDENTFRSKMSDKNNRKDLYDYVSERGDFRIGDYDSYENRLAGDMEGNTSKAGPKAQEVVDEFDSFRRANAQNKMQELMRKQDNEPKPKKTLQDIVAESSVPVEQNILNREPISKAPAYTSKGEERNYRPDVFDRMKYDSSIRDEDASVDKEYTPKVEEKEEDVFENYRNRFGLTQRGTELQEELAQIQSDLQDKYFKEFENTPEYKAIVGKKYNTKEEIDAANKALNDAYNKKYGAVINKEMEPYLKAYESEIFQRYAPRIQEGLRTVAKNDTSKEVKKLTGEVDDLLEKQHKILRSKAPSSGNAMNALMGSTAYNQSTVKERQELGALEASQRLLEQSQEIIEEAGKKGNTNFFAGLGRGFRDNMDIENFTFGLSEMADSKYLNRALEKAEKGEKLTTAEEKLLEASVVNMATYGYFSSDLGRGYGAGSTTAVSLPFMLEFIANPISGSGNAIAKGLLKFGLKKFGRASAQAAGKGALNAFGRGITSNAGKFAGRLVGDATAALGMEGTTGLGRVAAGTLNRLNENYKYGFDKNGNLQVEKVDNTSLGKAFARSVTSNFIENQSEMIFNAFKGWSPFMEAADKSIPGGLPEFIQRIKNSKASNLYRNIKNNPTFREAARRSQFHGLGEEYLEEVYNNFANVVTGEMSAEDAISFENNIDTFLGLAPTSVAFAALGLGGLAHERIDTQRKLNRILQNADDNQRMLFQEIDRFSKEQDNIALRHTIRDILSNSSITPEMKRDAIQYVYERRKADAIDDIQQEQTKEQDVQQEAAQESGAAIYETHNPQEMRSTVLRQQVSRQRLSQTGMSDEDIQRLEQADNQTRAQMLDAMEADTRRLASDYLIQSDALSSMESELDRAHAPEVEEARTKISQMNPLGGNITLIPLDSHADETHQYGVVLNGLNPDGTIPANAPLIVAPIESLNGQPSLSTFGQTANVSFIPRPASQPTIIPQDEALTGMLGDYQADADILDGTPIAPGATFPIMSDDGTMGSITVTGQDPATGQWLITDEEGKQQVSISDEELRIRKEEAEKFPILEEYRKSDEEYMNARVPIETLGKRRIPNGLIIVPTGFSGDEIAYDLVREDGRIIDSGNMTMQEFNELDPYEEQPIEKSEESAPQPVSGKTEITESGRYSTENVQPSRDIEQSSSIVMKEDGTPDFVATGEVNSLSYLNAKYKEKALRKIEVTKAAYAKDLEKASVALEKAQTTFDDAPIGREAKAEEALQKAKQAYDNVKRESDFWTSLYEIAKIDAEQPGDKIAEEIRAMGEPMDGRELAAEMLASGRLPLLYSDYKHETGFGENEAKGLFGLFKSKDNGGLSIKKAGEILMLADQEAGSNFFDPNDANAGRNAILDVLSSVRTRGGLIDYVKNNREAMAERERIAEQEYEEEQREAWAQENFGMSYADYITYEEVINDIIQEKALPKEAIQEFYNNFAEELNNWNNGRITEETTINERRSVDSGSESSEGLLSTEQLSDNRGIETDISAEADGRADNKSVPASEDSFRREVRIDQQGNPIDKNGNLIIESVANISDITDEDFVNPYRTIELPAIPQNVSDAIGSEGKPIIIKKNIFEKNGRAHAFTPQSSRDILEKALYTPDIVGQSQPNTKKNHWVAIKVDDKSPIVILEVNNNKDNVEIVGWYTLDKRNLDRIRRQAEREGGELLILTSKKAAASLSTLPSGLSSEDKGSEQSDKKQEKSLDNIIKAREQVDTNPSDAQKEAGNYKKGHIKLDGYDITIENSKGSERSGTDRDGNSWSITMNNDYGYIRGTESVDGDHIDVFLSDNPADGKVYVIDQINEDGSFDEHKVMYGFNSTDEARGAYLSNYSPGWKGLGTISEVSKDEFKKWIDSSQRKTKPFVEYKNVKRESTQSENQGNITSKSTSPQKNNGDIAENLPQSKSAAKSKKRAADIKRARYELMDAKRELSVAQSTNSGYTPEEVEEKKKRVEEAENELRKLTNYDEGVRFRIVHHGTGASFDKFTTEKIGTGEGNAAFGWGLYFTEKKDIAMYYANMLGSGLQKSNLQYELERAKERLPYVKGDVKKDTESHIQYLEKQIADLQTGKHLYDVEIPDDGYINWDKAIPKEQKRMIQEQAEKEGISFSFYGDVVSPKEYFEKAGRDLEGFQLYKSLTDALGSDKAASLFLNRAGFNGIEYEAGRHSANKKGNEMNFVVFDENAVRIIDHLRYRFMGEQGAANLDKAEEATTRMDNLNVAREMEAAFNAKKERIEKLRKSEPVEITGEEYKGKYELNRDSAQKYILDNLRGEYNIDDTGEKIKISKKGAKKVTSHSQGNEAHMKSIVAIPELIRNSIFIEEQPAYKEKAQYDSYRYYVVGLKIGEEDYTVRITIGVKNGEFYYDHYLTEIEKGNLIEVAQSFKPTEDAPNPSYAKNKDSILLSILQTNDKENAKKIKMATGWERGADGKWRYEVEDFEVDSEGLARKNRLWSNLSWGKEYDLLSDKLFDGIELTEEESSRFDELAEKANDLRKSYQANDKRYLDDYVKDDRLFKAYPELKQIRVKLYNAPTSNTGATYYESQNLIRVNESALNHEDFRSILAHEVQHAVQVIEGFARGGNRMTYRRYLDALKEKRDAWSMLEEFDRKREELGKDASQIDVYNALRDEYLSDGFNFGDGFIPSRTAFDNGFNLWVRGYDKEGYEDSYDEYQHLINKFGLGFDNDRYKELSGEVESRNVQSRMNITPEERRNTLASETEDVSREDQIFLNDAFSSTSLSALLMKEDTNQEQIIQSVEDLSGKLNTPVRIARSLNEVSNDSAKRAIENGRKVKGWFDNGEVVIYLPNAESVDDAMATVLHEVVGHKGLRELLVAENVTGAEERRKAFNDAMLGLYEQLPTDVQETVEASAKKYYDGNISIAMDEYLAEQAEKSETPSWWDKVVSAIRNLLRKLGIEVNLSANDIKYLLWESQRNLRSSDNPIDVAKETVMRSKLGIGEHSKRSYVMDRDIISFDNQITEETLSEQKVRFRIADNSDREIAALNSRISSLEKKISKLEDREELRRSVTDFIRKEISSDLIGYLDKQDLNSLLMQAQNAKSNKSLEKIVMNVKNVMLNAQRRRLQRIMDRLLSLKVQDVNGKNMSIAQNVDDSTRKIFSFLRGKVSNLALSGFEDEMKYIRREIRDKQQEISRLENLLGTTKTEDEKQQLTGRITSLSAETEELRTKLHTVNEEAEAVKEQVLNRGDIDVDAEMKRLGEKLEDAAVGKDMWTQGDTERMTALNILSSIITNKKHDGEIESIEIDKQKLLLSNSDLFRKRIGKNEAERKQLTNQINENYRRIVSYDRLVNDIRSMQVKQMEMTIEQLNELISDGKNSLMRKTEEENKRKRELVSKAIRSVEGKPIDIFKNNQSKENWAKKFFSAPLGSFEYMCRRINTKTLGKDGFFYKRFIEGNEGVLEAYDTYVKGMKEFRTQLDNKCKEIFGKRFEKISSLSDKPIEKSGVYITQSENEQAKGYGVRYELPLTKGQAMYIYQVWKMNDGRTKLELQGFDEESISQIVDFLGPEYVKFANWVQDDLLKAMRDKYNAKYLTMYNTSLAEIENYIPLKIRKEAIRQESALSEDRKERKKLEEKAGSLINRTVNTKPVDITRSGFDVLLEHGNQMEEWNAYARVRKDLDYILSSTRFRNQLNTNTRGSYENFYDAAEVATKSNHPDSAKFGDMVLGKLSKGIVGGNIAFRLNTALKQVLSAPAFFGYSQSPAYMWQLSKAMIIPYKNFKWCMENMPSFYERVNSGTIGNEKLDEKGFSRLMDKYIEVGMIPNKLVDAITCSLGAKSIYEYKSAQLRKAGIPKEEAHQQALKEADIYYNATQQSSHPAFLSPMQMSRTLTDRMLTTYQNSNIGYVRRLMGAFYDLTRSLKWKELKANYIKMYMEEGLSEQEAESKAYKRLLNENRKNVVEIALFGWGLNLLWNIGSQGLLGFFRGDGDDDDKKWTKDLAFLLTSPMKGLPGGNLLESMASGYGMNPFLVYEELDKFMKELNKTIDDYGLISPEIAYITLAKASRYAGVDLEVWGNIYLGIEGMTKDGALDDDKLIDIMYMLNSPKSSREEVAKELYKDEPVLEYAKKITRAMKYIPKENGAEIWVPGVKPLTKRKEKEIKKEAQILQMTPDEKRKYDNKELLKEHFRKMKSLKDDQEALQRYKEKHKKELEELRKEILEIGQ